MQNVHMQHWSGWSLDNCPECLSERPRAALSRHNFSPLVWISTCVCPCMNAHLWFSLCFQPSQWISESEVKDEMCPSTSAVRKVWDSNEWDASSCVWGMSGCQNRAGQSPAEMRGVKMFPGATVKGPALKCQLLTLPFCKNNTIRWWKQTLRSLASCMQYRLTEFPKRRSHVICVWVAMSHRTWC